MSAFSRLLTRFRRQVPERVLVLPLEPAVSSAENLRWARGISVAVTESLARLPSIEVVASGSARRAYLRGGPPPGAPGDEGPHQRGGDRYEELGSPAVLTGTFERSGHRLEISVRLVAIDGGSELWSGSWSVPPLEIFDVEAEIARNAAAALGVTPVEPALSLLHHEPTTDLEAYDLYLEARERIASALDPTSPAPGRDTASRGSRAGDTEAARGIEPAVEYLEKAVSRDALFADAWASLADYYRIVHERCLPAGAADPIDAAREATENALQVEPAHPTALSTSAYADLAVWSLDEAERKLRAALDVAPSHGEALRLLGNTLALRGGFSAAVATLERARSLDPLSHLALDDLTGAYVLSGRFEQATECARQGVRLDPEHATPYLWLGRCASLLSKPREAVTYCRAAADLSTTIPYVTAYLGLALIGVGDRTEAEDIANDLTRKARRGSPVAAPLGALLIHLDRVDEGIDWLETALATKERTLLSVNTHWLPVPGVAEHPRFMALLDRLPDPVAAGRRP